MPSPLFLKNIYISYFCRWAIFKEKNFTNIAAVLYASSRPDDQACTNDNLNGSSTTYSQYKSARYIGNSALLQPGLSLYKGKFFSGTELYLDGRKLNLVKSEIFGSYGMTGKENWTIFTNTNYTGDATCLLSYSGLSSDVKYDRVVYNKDIGIRVGSIRRGCFRARNGGKSLLILSTGERRVNPSKYGTVA